MALLSIGRIDRTDIAGREYFLAFLFIFCVSVLFITSSGTHCMFSISVWKWETTLSLHTWPGNTVTKYLSEVRKQS